MKHFDGRKGALDHFGLSEGADDEAIRDAYEAICFEVRQKALMNLGVPRIMKKRFQTLERAQEAYRILSGAEEKALHHPSFASMVAFEEASETLGTPPPWTPCIREYEKRMGEAQLKVANSFSAEGLSEGIQQLIHQQQAFHRIIYEGFIPVLLDPEHYPLSYALIDTEVKASQRVYSATLLEDFELLEANGIGNKGLHTVSEDLERSLESGKWEEGPALKRVLTEVYRIHRLSLLDEGS